MENASKALIIAGAILVSILLISLGMLLVQSVSEPLNSAESSISKYEITSFNNQFLLYEGTKKSSTEVIQLLETVIASNYSHERKIAVKLSARNFVMDSSDYAIFNGNTLIRCNSSNIVSLDEIITNVRNNKSYNYTVTLYYCDERAAAIVNNRHLNPTAGCILLINISRNY